MPRQEVTVTVIKQYKYPKAVFTEGKVNDNEAKRLALTDIANELNVEIKEDFFDAYMINDGTYAIKNSSLALKANHAGSVARILAQEDIEAKHGPLDPTTNPKIYKFDGEGNPYLKASIDDELHGLRNNYENRLHRALYVDNGITPRRNQRNTTSQLEEIMRSHADRIATARSTGMVWGEIIPRNVPRQAPPEATNEELERRTRGGYSMDTAHLENIENEPEEFEDDYLDEPTDEELDNI